MRATIVSGKDTLDNSHENIPLRDDVGDAGDTSSSCFKPFPLALGLGSSSDSSFLATRVARVRFFAGDAAGALALRFVGDTFSPLLDPFVDSSLAAVLVRLPALMPWAFSILSYRFWLFRLCQYDIWGRDG